MNSIYQGAPLEKSMLAELIRKGKNDEVKPVGTFAGVIYKSLYRSNGVSVPSDTSEQLIADGLKM